MDLFDVRKFATTILRDSLENTVNGTNNASEDYSAIAFLPVIMIVFVVFAICGIYNYRRYKHDRQQINQLSAFYDIIEGTYYRHKTYDAQYSDGIRSLLVTSNGSSLFFQPTPHIKAINQHIPTCTLTILQHLSGTSDCEEDESIVHMV